MSQYTTELRFLLQQNYDLGLRDYPIFDEAYRNVLNKKIMDEYYFREIGQETPDRFKHYLNHTMNMIMPYYNQLYKSQLLVIDPLSTYRDTESMKRDIGTTTDETSSEAGSSDSTGSTTAAATGSATTTGTENIDEDSTNTKTVNKFSVDSATPGGLIAIADLKTSTWANSANLAEGTDGDIGTNNRLTTNNTGTTNLSNQTMTNTGSVDGTTSGTRNVNLATVDEYLKTKFGFQGNQSKMLEAYRKTFINIDQGIIRELATLFMGVY